MVKSIRRDHLPFPMPKRPHSLVQQWRYLSFLHWEVDSEKLKAYIPEGLEIDFFNGKSYVGVIPFMMKNVRPRLLPSVPGISTFPEFNIRTYVTKNGKPGVLFLTLDAKSRITCFYAPRAYGLPYNYAKCQLKIEENYYSWKSKRSKNGYELEGSCIAVGEELQAKSGSLEEFLFERYSLYVEHKKSTRMAYTLHDPWKFRLAKAELKTNSFVESFNLGIKDPLTPDLVHISDGVYVHTWSIENLE
ncbi:MAG: hypothetical protein CMB56_004315 [Methanobacteriota archaeon]|nr:MAG: hypothetical protein CMB56_004315 [Euryarchaeota archaeon]